MALIATYFSLAHSAEVALNTISNKSIFFIAKIIALLTLTLKILIYETEDNLSNKASRYD